MVTLLAVLVCGLSSPATLTERDRDVITAYVFSHNKDSAETNDRDWVMNLSTSGSLHELCTKALSEHLKDKPELADLSKSIQERNALPIRLDTLAWDPKILLFDLLQKKQRSIGIDREFYRIFPRGTQAVRPELPGYTPDGKTAVLFAWIGPNHIHSVHEVALLDLKDGEWSVTWRQMAYPL